MAVKDYRLKLSKVQKLMGMYETYHPKSGKYGEGFVVTMFLTVKGGRIHLPDPYFFFGEQFIPVTDRATSEDTLASYIKAKKPIFSLVGENRIYVKISGFYNPYSGVTCNVELIKLRKQLMGDDALKVSGLSTRASEPLQRHCTALVKDIFKHVRPGSNGLTRLDFYRWRLGYTEELIEGSDRLVEELSDSVDGYGVEGAEVEPGVETEVESGVDDQAVSHNTQGTADGEEDSGEVKPSLGTADGVGSESDDSQDTTTKDN